MTNTSRYLLADRFRDYPSHPFALAQAFAPGSYVSFETALAHLPEAVYTTVSVVPGHSIQEHKFDARYSTGNNR